MDLFLERTGVPLSNGGDEGLLLEENDEEGVSEEELPEFPKFIESRFLAASIIAFWS